MEGGLMATSTRPDVKVSTPGRITDVKRKDTGWFNIRFSGEPSLFQTKREDLAGEAARFQRADKLGRVSHTTRHKELDDGRTFDDHYFEGIVEEVELDEPIQIEREESWGRRTPLPDAWRMALSTGAKLAVDTMPLMREDQPKDFETQKTIAYAWAYWIFTTPRPSGTPLDDPYDEGFEFGV